MQILEMPQKGPGAMPSKSLDTPDVDSGGSEELGTTPAECVPAPAIRPGSGRGRQSEEPGRRHD
eukprot:2755845-Alexandrium_andersonii.AAC.1